MRPIDLIARLSNYLRGFGYGSFSVQREVAALKPFVKKGVFIDGGANTGAYSRQLLKTFENAIDELHMFEPNKLLSCSTPMIKNKKILLNRIALSDRDGSAGLYQVEGQSGLSSLTKRKLDHRDLKMEACSVVETITLDSYLAKHSIKEVEFLKLDIEGHELDALRGASGAMLNRAIRCVQFEFGGCNIDTRTYFRDFWNLLVDKNSFQIFRLTPFGAKKLHKYSEFDEVFVTVNYLAVLQNNSLR